MYEPGKPIDIFHFPDKYIYLGLEHGKQLKNELTDFRAKWIDVPDYYEKFKDIDSEYREVVINEEVQDMNEQLELAEEKSQFGKNRCLNCIVCYFSVLKKYRLHAASYNNLFKAYQYILTLSCVQVNCKTTFSALCYI